MESTPSKAVKEKALNTAELNTLLAARYPAGEFAFFREVANATGSHCRRHADAIAISLWPSRGLYITGIEVKASRADWVKELRNPAKAEEIAKYCDYWYLVVGEKNIVQPGELPPTWGLMAPVAGKLKVITEAPKLQPIAADIFFVAALARAASEQNVDDKLINDAFARGRKAGIKEQEDLQSWTLKTALEKIESFEKAAGVKLETYNSGSIAEALEIVKAGGVRSLEARITGIRDTAQRIIQAIDSSK